MRKRGRAHGDEDGTERRQLGEHVVDLVVGVGPVERDDVSIRAHPETKEKEGGRTHISIEIWAR